MTTVEPLAWAAYTDDMTAWKRAGGRRAYNAMRRAWAIVRRIELWRIHPLDYRCGWQRRAARRFGVSPATICHDWRLIRLGKGW